VQFLRHLASVILACSLKAAAAAVLDYFPVVFETRWMQRQVTILYQNHGQPGNMKLALARVS
jgi:hypothetical protein